MTTRVRRIPGLHVPTEEEMYANRDEAIMRADKARWRDEEALPLISSFARIGEEFSGNDLWEAGLPLPPGGDRRALGGPFRMAKGSLGLVTEVLLPNGEPKKVPSRFGHGDPIQVWVGK